MKRFLWVFCALLWLGIYTNALAGSIQISLISYDVHEEKQAELKAVADRYIDNFNDTLI